MTITKEVIEKRLEVLKRDLQTLHYQLNATEGAIIDCNFWLEELNKSDG